MAKGAHDYEELYRLLVGELGEYAIFLMDLDGQLTTWNEGVRRLLGYDENEFVGRPVSILFTPEDIASNAPEREREQAIRNGRAPDTRWHVRRDGSRLFVDGVVTAVFDKSGRLIGLTKVMRDVTERKRSEEERDRLLAQAQAEHKRTTDILESISDAFYSVDAEFRFTYISRITEGLWHRPRAELLGRHFWTEFPGSVGSESYQMHLKAMAERLPVHYETISPIIGRWIDVSLYPEAGGGLSCYFRDISERKRVEEELLASEERFRNTFARAPIGMVLTTVEGLLVESNQAYQDLTGYGPEELARITFLDLTHPEDRVRNQQVYEQLLRGEIPSYTIEKRYLCKHGRVIWTRATATLRRDAEGRPREIVGLVENIDERKRVERERERLLGELERSNEELAQFAHVVSHDLQAPLRMIKGFTELLVRHSQGQPDKTASDFLAMITEGVGNMEQLIRALLQYAQAGEQQPAPTPLRVKSVIDAVLTTLRPQISEAHAEVTYGELPTSVRGDDVLFQQLFQNLISNAIKYRRDGMTPRIHITADRNEAEWRFSIKDNGVGIAKKDQERIFQPLKRLHGSEIPGTGIGLAVCKKIVERQGGRIWVESEPSHGSTFYFTVPV